MVATDCSAVRPQLQPEEEVRSKVEVGAAADEEVGLRLGFFPLEDLLGGSGGELAASWEAVK